MNDTDYDLLVQRAASVDCPDCPALIGQPCQNDQKHETPWIHIGRCEAADQPQRCGDKSPSLRAGRAGSTCALPNGHQGWHRDDDNQQWTLNGDDADTHLATA